MSPKITYFLATLLAILCLLQQFGSTTAANTQAIRRGLSHEELAARRQLQQNTNNQLYKNQYNNEDVDDEDDDDVDDDEAGDGSDAEDEDDADNLALRYESSENAAQAQEQNISEGAEDALANSEEGADVEGRARRRRRGRRGGRGRRRRAGRRRGRRGGRRGRRRGSRKGLRKVRKSRKHSSG